MSKDTCQFHVFETQVLKSGTMGGSRNPVAPMVQEVGRCTHREGRNLHLTCSSGGDLRCKGDLDKCLIPSDRF